MYVYIYIYIYICIRGTGVQDSWSTLSRKLREAVLEFSEVSVSWTPRLHSEIPVRTNQVSCCSFAENGFLPCAPVDFRRKPEPAPHCSSAPLSQHPRSCWVPSRAAAGSGTRRVVARAPCHLLWLRRAAPSAVAACTLNSVLALLLLPWRRK